MRDRVSELERLYITSHYYAEITGELEKGIQTYELYKRTYPRDSVPPNNLSITYSQIGDFQKALDNSLEAIRLDPNANFGYLQAANAYRTLNRLEESRRILQEGLDKGMQGPNFHGLLYNIATAQNDSAAMQRELDWARGKPESELFFGPIEYQTALSRGQVKKSREITQRSLALAQRLQQPDLVAVAEALAARGEAGVGNYPEAIRNAEAALRAARNSDSLKGAAQAYAAAGDYAKAESLAAEMTRLHPTDTLVNAVDVPTIRALIEIKRGNGEKAVELLRAATPYAPAIPLVLNARGNAFLRAGKGSQAAQQFQKLLDQYYVFPVSHLVPLARLGLARAYALEGDKAKSRTAYQDFFALWKDADPDVPILKAAQAEYAKLQ